jgi:hypothetical protein
LPRNEEALFQALRGFKVDAVIHFAAKACVVEKPIRPGDPPELVAVNTFLKAWFSHDFKTIKDVVEVLAAAKWSK